MKLIPNYLYLSFCLLAGANGLTFAAELPDPGLKITKAKIAG